MANGFGSLYVGSSGLRGAQNALNVVANNLSNIDTQGYVRQQVHFEDINYNYFGSAAVSDQYSGLGVGIGDVVHARDQFLDQSYRLESGRYAFYNSQYDAVAEIETLLQETGGISFSESVVDLYGAFAEFQKDPSDTVNLNLVAQKANIFIVRAQNVYDGMKAYQTNINTKIKNDVKRINEIGKEIYELNHEIQRVEAGKVETAMTLRDQRDALIDELSSLASISYKELPDGIVKIKIEGTDFLNESQVFSLGLKTDPITGFVDPYWEHLSSPLGNEYYYAFKTDNISAVNNTDVGEIKSLLLARGDKVATYNDIDPLTSEQYNKGISNSVMMNAMAELDSMIHSLTTAVNNLLSPITEAKNNSIFNDIAKGLDEIDVRNERGETVKLTKNTMILDTDNVIYGSDMELPPPELFSRTGCERYSRVYYTNPSNPNDVTVFYVYNKEDSSDPALTYSIKSLDVNKDVVEDSSRIPHIMKNGSIAYSMADKIYNLWEDKTYVLNPSDTTPCSYSEFYAKMVGAVATQGSVFKTTADSLQGTVESIESSRQAVIGVSSDEELTNMIKYQNAYNAASRYINTVSQMIDHLLNTL